MLYAPHILYKKLVSEMQTDKGKPIPPKEEWVLIGQCRCDDDSTQELVSSNGKVYKSRYHVVLDKTDAIQSGDEIRCETASGKVRGEGVVGMVKSTNYLDYSELWT